MSVYIAGQHRTTCLLCMDMVVSTFSKLIKRILCQCVLYPEHIFAESGEAQVSSAVTNMPTVLISSGLSRLRHMCPDVPISGKMSRFSRNTKKSVRYVA